ncbi:MAG TPA: SDR family oxidoreductase [Bacillales bacterium]|nr:SDR family oxidoreductase [Bacillales bacterium]
MTIFAKDSLKGKHALVTGATGGIGYETAKVLAAMGASVTVTGRKKEKLEQLAEEIHTQSPEADVFTYAADLAKAEDRKKLVETAENNCGLISMLVNSAGISGGTAVDQLKQGEMERIMHLNYTATVLLTQLVYKKMMQKKEGAIVNVSSLSGLRGTHGNTAYAASKFALIGFTHSMAVEAIEYGVRVNAVCPGYVDTDMGKAAIQRRADRAGRSLDEQMEVVNQGLPSGRITTPQEVANTIAFLLTDAAGNIVGESVKISGGSVL